MVVLRYCFVISPEVWKPFTTLVPGPIRAPHRSYWALIDPDTKVIRMCGPQLSVMVFQINFKLSIISLLMNIDTYKTLKICVLTGQMLRLWSGL